VLDSDEVLATAARFGVATLTFGRTGWLVEVQELRAAAPMGERRAVLSRPQVAVAEATPSPATETAAETAAIPPIYVAAIARAAEHLRHEGEVQPSTERVHVHVQIENTTLSLVVDPSTHVIDRAAFANAPHPGVMETFCALLESVPILDAADHGALRLELALRDERSHRTVAGIVTVQSLAPCFRLPTALVRAALAEYRTRTDFSECVSTHDPGPGASWRAMAAPERAAKIRTALDGFAKKRGGTPGAIELIAVEIDIRLVLRIDDALLSRCGARIVLDVEQALRHTIDPRLEVVLEEIRDRNRKRRLAVVE